GRKARYMKLEMKGKSSSGNNQPAICEITFNEEIPKNPAELSQTGENLPMSELIYASSVDGTKPLYANVCYLKDGKAKPLIVVMHGVAAERRSMDKDISDFAKHGLFAIAPDMRGRGNSAGKFDCGGLGVYDIVDAINEVIAKFPSEIDAGNINIVGYSGGGGNCFSAFVRFPDLFHVVAPFFGISDYGTWFQLCGDSWNNEMSKAVGGTPAQVPLQYAARNSCLGAANNRNSKLHVFWDESETICPPVMNERFLESYRAAGLSNAVAHISRVTDAVRWIHGGGRIQSPMLEKADDLIVNEIRAPVPDLSLPQKGILTVCGYLVTRQFQVFIEDGQRGVVKIEYDLTGKEPEIKVKENPDNLQVKISLRTPPGKDQRP
ncbi:MAG: alpha/beta fold hydrolase, partial [Lentisphaerota bacterium]